MATGQGMSALAATTAAGDGGAGGEDWWCVKAAGGNGGLDIWVMHAGNWKSVAAALSDNESYVIQVRMWKAELLLFQFQFSEQSMTPTCSGRRRARCTRALGPSGAARM